MPSLFQEKVAESVIGLEPLLPSEGFEGLAAKKAFNTFKKVFFVALRDDEKSIYDALKGVSASLSEAIEVYDVENKS